MKLARRGYTGCAGPYSRREEMQHEAWERLSDEQRDAIVDRWFVQAMHEAAASGKLQG